MVKSLVASDTLPMQLCTSSLLFFWQFGEKHSLGRLQPWSWGSQFYIGDNLLTKETLVVFVFGAHLPLELEIHLMRSTWLRRELIGCYYMMWIRLVAVSL